MQDVVQEETKTGIRDTILIVDDDSITRKTLRAVLSKNGYRVVDADSGAAALEMFSNVKPDLVLLDVVMPGMDGFEVCAQIRSQPEYQTLPILMLTGLDDVGSIDNAFDVGATDFITKPINWALLGQRLRYAFRTRDMYVALKKQKQQLVHAQKIAKLGYWELSRATMSIRYSHEVEQILGEGVRSQEGNIDGFLSLLVEDEREALRADIIEAMELGVTLSTEVRLNINPDGGTVVHLHGEPIRADNGDVVGIGGVLQDVTERRRDEAIIEYQANYDNLTSMPNRRFFLELLKQHIAEATTHERLIGLMFLGIDRMDVVVDSLGHRAGDQLIMSVADRLQPHGDERYTLGRFGGDVFAICLSDVHHTDEVSKLATELRNRARGVHDIVGQELYPTVSIGMAIFPFPVDGAEELMKCADAALSMARKKGGDQCQYYSAEILELAHRRLDVEKGLRRALERDELMLHYQPQIDVQSGKVVGIEALIRWMDPHRGLIMPGEFIDIAEETGLIVPIGEWVLREACKYCSECQKMGLGPLRVGVNLSAKQFDSKMMTRLVERVLGDTNLGASSLDLEITESAAMENFDATVKTLHCIRELGVLTSLDDFGTGYSSLKYVQRLPVNTIKIDQSFVRNIGPNGENGALAKVIVAMAHSLGLHVIAEGVETPEQQSFLGGLGCDELQGYLFSRPVPPAELESYVKKSLERVCA